MAIDLGLRFLLGFTGIPDKDLDALEHNLPALARVCRAAQSALPVIEKLLPLTDQLEAIFKPLEADLNAVSPLLTEFVNFINSKAGSTNGGPNSSTPLGSD